MIALTIPVLFVMVITGFACHLCSRRRIRPSVWGGRHFDVCWFRHVQRIHYFHGNRDFILGKGYEDRVVYVSILHRFLRTTYVSTLFLDCVSLAEKF